MCNSKLLACLSAVLLFGSSPTWSAAIVFTDGDSRTAWIVDTEAGTATSFDTSAVDIGYPIAVTDRIVIGGRDNTGAAEYDLTGNPTGNTYAGGGGFGELLDGTTNGVDANYAIECCGSTNSVVVADLNWEGQAVLFDLPDEVNQSSGGSGIAYDSATQSLWVANFSGTVFNLSLSGDVLSSFTVDQPGGKCCLAYDEATDSLWVGVNSQNIIHNYAKTGALIASVTIAGWSPANMYGAEMTVTGSVTPPGPGRIEPTAVPVDSPAALIAIALTLMLLAHRGLKGRLPAVRG